MFNDAFDVMYQPTLINVPAGAFSTWKREFDAYFANGTDLSLHYFAATTVTGTAVEEKARIIGNSDKDLVRFLDEQCPTKAVETLRKIILTTHTTLMRRTVTMVFGCASSC